MNFKCSLIFTDVIVTSSKINPINNDHFDYEEGIKTKLLIL